MPAECMQPGPQPKLTPWAVSQSMTSDQMHMLQPPASFTLPTSTQQVATGWAFPPSSSRSHLLYSVADGGTGSAGDAVVVSLAQPTDG